ncbi:hypothetical protein [Rhodanobacter sp. DHB23]|uniref:hypothetical protein n=1 Tax=Rhodanobacter sp. DHB23 TaxID=2775923 RepID=UPI00178731BE|nr:hypothetical protein [Rhodanobacter sp. DHB23]MBD8874270.1 hypothetical protein [Rhodanobacter sp. DHB23]
MSKRILLAIAAMPLATSLCAADATPQFAAVLPFHDCNGMICFQAGIDGGQPRTLALDTGDTASIMLDGAARSMGWRSTPVLRNGKPLPGFQDGGRHVLTLGKASLAVEFAVTGPASFGSAPLPADGTLAYTAFKDRVLQIDYPHHLLRISAPVASGTVAARSAGTLQLIRFGHYGPPIVVGGPFTVDGHPVRAQIDTMYTGTMVVYDAALAGLDLHKQGTPRLFRYTDGGVEMLGSTARSLGFADRRLLGSNPTVYFVGSGKNPVHQPDGLFEATVGNPLFAHSVVTMDFHAMTLDVRPAG